MAQGEITILEQSLRGKGMTVRPKAKVVPLAIAHL